jgi:hypothetical protein
MRMKTRAETAGQEVMEDLNRLMFPKFVSGTSFNLYTESPNVETKE